MDSSDITVEPRDKQVESIEDFIESLLRFNLDELPEYRKESLNYDINEVIISLEGIVYDYELAKREHDLGK